MIKNVRRDWIQGVLMQSLHDAPYMDVGFKLEQDRVARPWGLVWESESDKTLPEDVFIESIFKDYAANALLILGQPGSGKTVTLLDLTKHLLYEASTDDTDMKPIPVVFNLSSWAFKSLPLFDWLIDELREKYGVRDDLARFWLQTDALALMLDGLDEVAEAQQQACVEAINVFRRSGHGLAHIAICSRVNEYESLTQQLDLTGALMVQPLSFQQADEYLAGLYEPLAATRELFQTDEQLQTWSQTPLFLSVMAIAYHGLGAEELKGMHTGSLNHLYEAYVDRVLNQHRLDGLNKPRKFESKQIIRWLTWLAARMDEHKQTIYLIEHMQPDWLTLTPQEWKKQNRLIQFLRWVLGERRIRVNDTQWSWEAAKAGAWEGGSSKDILNFGLLGGLLVGLIFVLSRGLLVGLIFGLLFVLLFVLIGLLIVGLIVGLNQGLIGGPVRKSRLPNQGSWSNRQVGRLVGLSVGLPIGLLGGLLVGPLFGLLAGLIGGLLTGLIGGLRDFCRHFFLRKLLSRLDFLPSRVKDLVPFLDEAKENLLLRQVGGGYIFIHRTLLEYFARLEKGKVAGEED